MKISSLETRQPLAHPAEKPAILLGSSNPPIPEDILDVVMRPASESPSNSSGRWTVTPAIEAHHRHYVSTAPEAELRDGPNSELKTLIQPMLSQRYLHRGALTVAELGPATSTTVAQTLARGDNRYLGVDLSEPLTHKQMEYLEADGISRCYHVKGDTYALPLHSESCDLIVTSCHPPFVSSSLEDRKTALDEVYRALKPAGEFLLFPFYEGKQPPEFQDYLRERFTIEARSARPSSPERQALILKKKPG